jgi:hypothetical protein
MPSPLRSSASSGTDFLPLDEAAPANHVYELPASVTKALNLPTGVRLARMGVHGEGSCGYHSMCAALNIEDYVHRSTADQKRIAYDFRCRFKDTFSRATFEKIRDTITSPYSKSYESVAEGLCDPHAWADEVAIKHAANILHANIMFLDLARNRFYCNVHNEKVLKAANKGQSGTKDVPTILIHWVNHTHFEVMARILDSGPDVTNLQFIFRPHDRDDDATIVNALMTTYKRECF